MRFCGAAGGKTTYFQYRYNHFVTALGTIENKRRNKMKKHFVRFCVDI